MQITGYVGKTGVKSGVSERTGKNWSRSWMILEGLFCGLGFGVSTPDQGRKIIADVVSNQSKYQDKQTGDDRYKTNYEVIGWIYA
jgi:hypothetical protein